MTTNEALIGLPDGDVTRARSIARLVPNQRWDKDAILAIRGVPANPRPRNPADDSVIESMHNPHIMLDAEQLSELEDEQVLTSDMPVCLHEGRQLPSLRITKADLERYGFTPGCPRCLNTQVGDVSSSSNHWESCRRRVYQQMYHQEDPKLLKWLRDHSSDTRKVGPSIGLEPSPGRASSSTSPAPDVEDAPKPDVVKPPGDMHVLEGLDADDFTDVISLSCSATV